jgi:hypothetical protein
MTKARAMAVHVLGSVGLDAVVVATPMPITQLATVGWVILVAIWVTRQTQARGRLAGVAEWMIQLAVMSVIVLAADSAPRKVVDRMKARRVTMARREMTIAELQEPETRDGIRPVFHGTAAPTTWPFESFDFRHSISPSGSSSR